MYSHLGHNFIKTMLRLALERTSLSVIDDQIGSPTSAQWLAQTTAFALAQAYVHRGLTGLYHLVPKGYVSWYQYCQCVFEKTQAMGHALRVKNVEPILSQDFPTAARRPLNSRLDTSLFSSRFGLSMPTWQEGVYAVLPKLLESLR